ncbi:lipid-binding SYLF domain-containing protein [Alloacidobacterium dinghuense]|uniref:lipid-binding SYLF domain-containing protein n=1 Tax=Alloacidobacterium dinghuense TaxID=2763107 RepID=UPI002036D025|nr:lipid-binding SYLF domain-containing protein [Alloacidobacterium dinghuense]
MIQRKTCYRFTKAAFSIFAAALCSVPLLARADDVNERITAAGQVFQELVNADNGIPRDLLNKADCVIVLPSVKKGGLIIGAQYGKGLMTCRSGANFNGKWSAPIMMQSSGGSFGLQAGGEATDFVILVMNDDGARTVMKGRAKLGADASVAAGPVGRDAEASTSGTVSAQMLSYSRTKGVFGGLSLNGTSLNPDGGDNEKLYGKKISGQEIFAGSVPAPASAHALLAELTKASPKNLSKGK